MNILTRQEAVALKLSRYFTGQPCKHGHISERYTRSLNCIECLHPTFEAEDIKKRKAERAALKPRRLNRSEIRDLRSRMKLIRIRLHEHDLLLFESMAFAAAMAHEPAIRMSNIRARLVPKRIGVGWSIYGFMCFPEDAATLKEFEGSLEGIRRPMPGVSAIGMLTPLQPAERLRTALAIADAEADRSWPAENFN